MKRHLAYFLPFEDHFTESNSIFLLAGRLHKATDSTMPWRLD